MSAGPERVRRATVEAYLIWLGARTARRSMRRLARATLGQCEALDLVPTADDANYVRCTNTGVKIRETDEMNRARHRTVCPKHGYCPTHTPPVLPEEL